MANITGTGNADTIRGTKGNDVIQALGGSDRIFGSAGIDRIVGGDGFLDQLSFVFADAAAFDPLAGVTTFLLGNGSVRDAAGSFVTRYEGIARVVFDLRNTGDFGYTINAAGFNPEPIAINGFQSLIIYTGNGNDRVTGSAFGDLIFAGQGIDVIDAGAGFDEVDVSFLLTAELSNTILLRQEGDLVTVERGGETDRISNAERVRVSLAFESDPAIGVRVDGSAVTTDLLLFDGRGDDVLIGGSGVDIFVNNPGGFSGGTDVYTGGAGADIFDFVVGTSGFDGTTITDFAAEDVIDLSYNSGAFLPGEPIATFFIGTDRFSGLNGEVRYDFANGQTLVEIDFNGDRVADATLTIANGTFDLGAFASDAPFFDELFLKITGAASVFTGTEQADRLTGTADDDTIDALGGNDTASGGDGADRIRGGDGDDTLLGEGGDDDVVGGSGNDTIDGGDGNDLLDGGAGDDTLRGGNGFNRMSGGEGNDRLFATSGGWINAGDGDDLIDITGGGTDVTGAGGSSYFADGDAGDDRVILRGTADFVSSGAGDGDDSFLVGGTVAQLYLDGGDGDDVFDIRNGRSGDAFDGVAEYVGWRGDDRYLLGVAGRFQLDTGDGGLDTIVVSTGLRQTVNVIDFRGGEAGTRIDLSGFGANAFANGTLTIAQVEGGVRIDHAASGSSYFLGDVLIGNLSRYNLGIDSGVAAPTALTLNDFFEFDPTIEYSSLLIGADGDDVIRGFGGNDELFGAGGADRIEGGLGDDFLDGGSGVDRLIGGDGDDVYGVDTASDLVIEDVGGGTDTVVSSVNLTLRANVENLVLAGTARIGTGNGLDNGISGSDGDDTLRGAGGSDAVSAGAGVDRLFGDAGNDVLVGGAGRDSLTGGVGADRFAFLDGDLSADLATTDVVLDFAKADGDVLDFSAVDAVVGDSANEAFAFVDTAHFSGVAGELRFSIVNGRTLVEGDVDGDRVADLTLRIDSAVVLEAAQFVL